MTIAFHYVTERLQLLNRVIKSVSSIPTDKTKIIVNSNKMFDVFGAVVHETYNLKDPYHLTWQHKKYIEEFLNSDFTHFIYLEDDMEINAKNLEYWNKTNSLFKRNNLNFIPAFHRYEYKDNKKYSLDSTHKPGKCQQIQVEGKTFLSLPQPYQGMFVMDREMAQEHLTSQHFNVGEYHNYGIRESANLGNMYTNVPEGWSHRALVPLEDFKDCLVWHNSNNYSQNLNSPHAKILIDELLDGN